MRGNQSGFTLVEALVAILVLVFGLIAVSNLMLVATSSTSVANQSSAATAVASEVMEQLKMTPWPNLAPGGDVTSDQGGTAACDDLGAAGGGVPYFCDADVPGVGRIHARWAITLSGPRTLFLQVRAEGLGPLAAGRSRAEFSMFRTCTEPPPTCAAGGGL